MSVASLVEGSVFAERYRIVRCIAAGGMGAVYEVTHLETKRRRALKVMHPHLLQSDELRDRFRQEARVAADVESEFIVDVFDAGVDAATQMPFLVMELLRGDELGKLLQVRGHFTPAEVVTYLHQAALALDKTHRASIVHRDLKPENLFLTHREDGAPRIKVLDFGIAKVMSESGTQANATSSFGTPLYMAPEQFRLGQKVSPSIDLYALAMVAYTLLVGKAYWHEEAQGSRGNVFAFVSAVVSGPEEHATERARRLGVPLPPAFDVWFAKAAAFAPEDRFPTASALVAALAEALGISVPGLSRSGPQVGSALPLRAEVRGAPGTTGPGNTGPAISGRMSAGPGMTAAALAGTKPPESKRGLGAARVVVAGVGVAVVGAGGFMLMGREAPTMPVQASAPAEAPAAVAEAVQAPAAAAVTASAPAAVTATAPVVTPAAAAVTAAATETVPAAAAVTAPAAVTAAVKSARAAAPAGAPRRPAAASKSVLYRRD